MAKLPLTFPRPECSCLLAAGLAKPQIDGSSLSRNAAHAYPEHEVPLPGCLTTCSFQDGFLQPFFVPRLLLPPPTGQLLHRGCVLRNPVPGAGGILSSTPAHLLSGPLLAFMHRALNNTSILMSASPSHA